MYVLCTISWPGGLIRFLLAPYRVRWQDLKDLFRKAGTVLRADVSLGPDNRSRGYGTVLLATAEDAGRAVDMFSGYMWQTRVLEVRLDRMVGEGGAVGYEQQLGQQQQLGGQQPYGGMGQMVQQMLSPSMGMPQLGLHAYAKHNLGLGSLSGPGSPSVGGSSTPVSMSASMSGSGSASASGSRPSLPTSVSASLTGGSGSGMVDDDGARRSPMPLSFAYQLHAQGLGQG